MNALYKSTILVEAAKLYYDHQLSQLEISKKLGVSRPTVSRLLQQARNTGIVRIEITDPSEVGTQLESALVDKFNLKKVLVVPNDTDDTRIIKKRLGKATVIFLDQLISEGIILGISWGTTMQEVARQIRPRSVKNMVVVQLNGGISRAEIDTHASEIAKTIGDRYKAIPYLMPLPAVVDNAALKNTILSDGNISRTLELGRKADIALFTIGSFGHDSILVRADYFEPNEVDKLLQSGAVGDICSRILKTDGTICSKNLNSRTIGIELKEIKKKPYSIAVAGGKEKLAAIQAGLKGKWFNCLITDEWIATELLRD
ncbi:MAG: sugar-binding transcriptional regulator [Candidatus Marinimicrobia bacterium]|nr:sugar-binding transcriptional regulator [Candidatus Neomarinimicrobiota bacterium]